jgi:eukaryotic-like serine/threonine-protein kinase
VSDAARADDIAARERYAQVTAIFDAVLDMPVADQHTTVTDLANGDPVLISDVRELLAAHLALGGFLEASVFPDAMRQRVQAAIGDRYTVAERVASGGMAAIYRADDLRHSRRVAIKVWALDAESPNSGLATAERFLDEIRVTATLQHPNVMPLFDSGAAAGLLYFVMPFVDGESLRAMLTRSTPLSVDDAVLIATGIAEGLAHAHSTGIVHRDLKPENILLSHGQPVICDFGIALATASLTGARLTQPGAVVGTPQYMAPEQAEGTAPIDARTDVYALGAILYEMLTGDPPHVASTAQGVLAKLRAEQPTAVHLLRPTVSVAVSDVVAKALSKVPADRFPTVRAMRDALRSAALRPAARARQRWSASWIIASISAMLVVVVTVRLASQRAAPQAAARFTVAPIANAAIGRAPALTPDGLTMVYAGAAESGRTVFVRHITELEAKPLSGTHGALSACISPNGRRIAFTTSDDRLVRIGIDGSDMADITGVFRYSNAVWLNDSSIVYDSYGQEGLTLVRAAPGGASHPVTQLDTLRHDSMHLMPYALGDGGGLVFIARRDRSGPGANSGELSFIRIGATDRNASPYVSLGLQSRGAFGFVDGWLLYVRADGRALMAVQFDGKRGVVRGEPIAVLVQEDGGIETATLAANGTLLYSRHVLPRNAPVLVDSAGVTTPVLAGLSGAFMNPRVSHDGRQIVVQRLTDGGADAWTYDLATGTQRRLTVTGSVVGPAWSADGTEILYASTRGGRDALWRSAADDSAAATRVVAASGAFAASPSRDPAVVLFQRRVNGAWSIWRTAPPGASTPLPVVVGAYDAFMPSLSPDGSWLTYASSESGRYEVYMRPFPGPGAVVQVSLNGGSEPVWAPDGATIFFRADRKMMAAAITHVAPEPVTRRRALFADTFDGDMPMPHRNYDVMPDGRRFVMIAPTEDMAPGTIVVLNWLWEFRQRVAHPSR